MTIVPGLVLDASVTVAWCLDEGNTCANSILDLLEHKGAIVPNLWPIEVSNALAIAERRGFITRSETTHFLMLLRSLPILVEIMPEDRVFGDLLGLAREQMLTVYDAAYLDLAMRTGLPLATFDEALCRAAGHCGVKVITAGETEG